MANNVSKAPAKILATGNATPPLCLEQKRAYEIIEHLYGEELNPRSIDLIQKILSHDSIRTRYFAADDEKELLSFKNESPDKRIERFTKWSINLSCEAINNAISAAGISKTDIEALIVNTCTGYLCPGISTYLMEKLELNNQTKAFDLLGAGCGGALPNIELGSSILKTCDGAVLCVAVEICSATFQMANDPSLLISNALFGDGAASVVLSNCSSSKGAQIISHASTFIPQERENVRFVYKNGELHNKLSSKLPTIIAENVAPFIRDFLNSNSLSTSQIDHWAIHPGGEKIISNLQKMLSLSNKKLTITRDILSEYGNMSSPTVLFQLDRILDSGVKSGDLGLLVGFGAGLSIHLMLLQW
ncbi:type III polyketide synthase [Chitinispirillales bacterium ANBcel5]|uniref:type III polyketide synthase n=1 Tax=Cellulosispirillum alkaliphilum TaxID=3039283 RepID=UPI002A5333FF|nr:type III polyketide synthase [Chitinispirillales bacterium ANBcel5]